VPIFLVSAIAVTVIVSGLDRGLSYNAQQQLRVAKNLVARAVHDLDEPATALASSAELRQALDALDALAALEVRPASDAGDASDARNQVRQWALRQRGNAIRDACRCSTLAAP
jgi:ribonuclease HI